MKDAHGNPLEVVGSWSEVTARKTAEQAALQASEQRLNDAIAAISEGFSLYDTEDRLVLGNYKFIFTGAQSVETRPTARSSPSSSPTPRSCSRRWRRSFLAGGDSRSRGGDLTPG